MERNFVYDTGYFRLCRRLPLTANETWDDFADAEFQPICWWNPLLTGHDLTEQGIAAFAIAVSLHACIFMLVISVGVSVVALFLSFVGYYNRNSRTLHAAVLYVIGGLVICTGTFQFISVVDYEMSPRQKPDPEGNPSKYRYNFGPSLLMASLSFVGAQFCAVGELALYFRRYRRPEDMIGLIPGMRCKVEAALQQKRRCDNGICPTDSAGDKIRKIAEFGKGELPLSSATPSSALDDDAPSFNVDGDNTSWSGYVVNVCDVCDSE